MIRFQPRLCLAFSFTLVLVSAAFAGPKNHSQALTDFLHAHPGVQTVGLGSGDGRIYGSPFATGATATAAFKNFMDMDAQSVFGIPSGELVADGTADVLNGKFTAGYYIRVHDGLVVENQYLTLLARNESGSPVVLASSALIPFNSAKLNPVYLTQFDAMFAAQQNALPDMTFEAPTLMITNVSEDPTVAYRIVGDNNKPAERVRRAYYFNATDGSLVGIRDLIYYTDVTGSVKGWGTPGVLPDEAGNPPVLQSLPAFLVSISGGNTATADAGGLFTIVNAGVAPVTVTASMKGTWATVSSSPGGNLTFSQMVTPPGPVDIVWNAAPVGTNTAQVNGYYQIHLVHQYVKSIDPTYPIDLQIPVTVNIASTCNAYYSANTVNFYAAGGGCPNTAYSTVMYHEYGHFVIDRAHPYAAGDYHEGCADTNAGMMVDDFNMALDFRGPGTGPLRNISTPDYVFPVNNTDVHIRGLAIAGSYWDLRVAMGAKLGSAAGLDYVRHLYLAEHKVRPPALSPHITIDLLTMDDDNANIYDGTPNFKQISDSFSLHNLKPPPINFVNIAFTPPANLGTPGVASSAPISVTAGMSTPNTSNMRLFVSKNGAAYVQTLLASGNPSTVNFPAQNCGDWIRYYIQVPGTDGSTTYWPINGPNDPATVPYATSSSVIFNDNFETNQGWTASSTATTGAWQRVVPVGCVNDNDGLLTAPEEDNPYGTGTRCYVTGNGANGEAAGTNDVDGGTVSLSSPTFDLSGGDGVISYFRYFYSVNGVKDNFLAEISNDNGATWKQVENFAYTTSFPSWQKNTFLVSPILAPTATMKLRFSTTDNPNDSVTEAALDDVVIRKLGCTTLFAGHVNLDHWDGDPAVVSLHVEFRNPTTHAVIQMTDLSPNSSGDFSVTVPSGTYEIAVKGDRWLNVVKNPVVLPIGSTTNFDLNYNGDATNDNAVNDDDLISVILDFSAAPSGLYGKTDFTGNNYVDDEELIIIILNFGQVGPA